MKRYVLVHFPEFLGIDLSITHEVILLWIAAGTTFGLVFLSSRRKTLFARGLFQNIFETLIDFIENEVIRDGIGQRNGPWAPFLITLFFFILISNLLGLLPIPATEPVTANINVTAALALAVFGFTIAIDISKHGFIGFAKKFMPSGIPWWLAILIVPIELVTWLARPFSLAIRLCANMLAGHTVILVFIGMTVGAAVVLKPLPLIGAVAMSVFELFVCFIQAFIFTMLAGLYIRDALENTH
ncbi:MAG: F0F1 ATP synthase subunit A [Lentisphaerae bacterium]|nr:F0F1 ATP synthase subunit A [Lentisphaerota bacterium]